jgi:pyruvate/2-oxoglutarate dehydrogenase complex dihydrolipoamide dehydrogenase (E3) component
MRDSFDLIVIGSGTAAREAASRAVTVHGARVAILERDLWGGSCPNVACAPTKAYLVAAEQLHRINTLAPRLGIDVSTATASLRAIRARKDELRRTQERWLESLAEQGIATYEGEASLLDSRTIRVGDRELSADHILIATGSRTAVPPIPGIDEIDWLDHRSMLELEDLPESLLVVGGGPVGLELGQAFSRFGAAVTIVDVVDRIAFRSDGEAAAELAAALRAEGIELVLGALVSRVERDDAGLIAEIAPATGDGEPRRLRVSALLLGAGRVPNVEGLALEAVGVETTRSGIAVDSTMRTNVEGIWAAGDVTGLAQLSPLGDFQGRLAVDDMFGASPEPADYSLVPTAIFTDPELAGVGLTEEEATAEGYDTATVSYPLRVVQRAFYLDATHGIFKLVYERGSRRVLGVHVVSPGASDVVQGYTLALRHGVTVDEIAAAHNAFPTFGEGVKYAAQQAEVLTPAGS